MTLVGAKNDSLGSIPRIFLVCAISSAPSADPCDFAVPEALGAGQAIQFVNELKLARNCEQQLLSTPFQDFPDRHYHPSWLLPQ